MDKAASDHFKVDSLGKPYAGDHLLIELQLLPGLRVGETGHHALLSVAQAQKRLAVGRQRADHGEPACG